MKLRTKILLFSSLFMLILILLVNTAIYFLFYNITANSQLDELQEQTNTMIETINSNPDIYMKDLLPAFLPANGMIRVLEKDGEQPIILTKENEFRNIPISYSESESKELLKNEEGIAVAVINKPIIWDDGSVVTLQVSEHLFVLNETMKTLLYVLVIASIVILIPIIIASMMLGKFILRPIHELILAMKQNTKQENWQTIDIKNQSQDELHEMGTTYNDMIGHLKENYEKQEVFVSDASHELKTPISIIKSYAQLLERRGNNNPKIFEESVRAIDQEADRMQHLVEQMLLLAKNRQMDTEFDRINFSHICSDTVRIFERVYDRKIISNIEEDIFVLGSEEQLKQIVYILLDNACKYSEKEIEIELYKETSESILNVTDYGQGIPEEDMAYLFDRFYRVDKARSRKTGGTGLGLAIANVISKAHRGDLSVTSEVGIGSTFSLKLPLIKET